MRINSLVKAGLIAIGAVLIIPMSAQAHVVVKPDTVGIGKFQTFTTSVPNEKDMPTIAVRVVIPEGMAYVTPTVKPGWKIETKKSGEGENVTVTEISWTEGVVPAGQRDEFTFSAKTPSVASELKWKAYQTYQDGTVVSWDQDPNTSHDNSEESVTPYSVTKVVDDLTAAPNPQPDTKSQNLPLLISIASLVIAIIALAKRSKTA